MKKIIAVFELDEEAGKDKKSSEEKYFESECGWLEESGIVLRDCLVMDPDSGSDWARYLSYLIDWAISHSGEEYSAMSPACHGEWSDGENKEESNV